MDEEKKVILAEIAAKQKEVRRLNIKKDTMQEMICHLRSRISSTHHRVRDIRSDIRELKDRLVELQTRH